MNEYCNSSGGNDVGSGGMRISNISSYARSTNILHTLITGGGSGGKAGSVHTNASSALRPRAPTNAPTLGNVACIAFNTTSYTSSYTHPLTHLLPTF